MGATYYAVKLQHVTTYKYKLISGNFYEWHVPPPTQQYTGTRYEYFITRIIAYASVYVVCRASVCSFLMVAIQRQFKVQLITHRGIIVRDLWTHATRRRALRCFGAAASARVTVSHKGIMHCRYNGQAYRCVGGAYSGAGDAFIPDARLTEPVTVGDVVQSSVTHATKH